MTPRHVRRRRTRTIDLEALAERDPDFAATDALLQSLGYVRTKASPVLLTRAGQISGRVVWRKDGRSQVWASVPCRG